MKNALEDEIFNEFIMQDTKGDVEYLFLKKIPTT